MREIKFRGMILFGDDQGRWIAGDLEHFTALDGREMVRIRHEIGYKEIVIPQTVGQYIGMKDKYGLKIYEGHVLKFSRTRGFNPIESFHVVRFCEKTADFRFWDGTSWCPFLGFSSDDMEVVGHIFNDPEFEKRFGEIYRSKEQEQRMRDDTIREIEFRGREKRHDGTYGPWIYGGYSHADLWPEIIDYCGIEQGVEPETVGQWTGLLDISGNRLYEGDVVETKTIMIPLITGVLIYSNRLGAYMVYGEDGNGIFVMDAPRFKLLGNIFDDPELNKQFGEVYRKEQ